MDDNNLTPEENEAAERALKYMFGSVKVIERATLRSQDDTEIEDYPVAILVQPPQSENNVFYSRLVPRACGHADCAEKIGYCLN